MLITVIIISGAAVFVLYMQEQDLDSNNGSKSNLTTDYTTITVQEAYDLVYNQKKNIMIIDVPTMGITRYNESHLENAIMVGDQSYLPEGMETLYNTTKDILIYDDDGRGTGLFYCEQLINHTYGKVYYLTGGFSEWKAQGYPYWNLS